MAGFKGNLDPGTPLIMPLCSLFILIDKIMLIIVIGPVMAMPECL